MATYIFQKIRDTMLKDVSIAIAYLNDIVLTGVHRMSLEKLDLMPSPIAECGLVLRAEKCNLCVNIVRYLMYIIGEYCRRSDPENAQVVKSMPRLTDAHKL